MTRDELIARIEVLAENAVRAQSEYMATSLFGTADMLRADGEEIERLRKERDEALARVSELEAAQRMRPMSEAPRDGTMVLGLLGNVQMVVKYDDDDSTWRIYGEEGLVAEELRGWWPLPEDGK